jgi:hypothetical protein
VRSVIQIVIRTFKLTNQIKNSIMTLNGYLKNFIYNYEILVNRFVKHPGSVGSGRDDH